jgi:hypothetical protein
MLKIETVCFSETLASAYEETFFKWSAIFHIFVTSCNYDPKIINLVYKIHCYKSAFTLVSTKAEIERAVL